MKKLLVVLLTAFTLHVYAQDKCEKNLNYQKDKMTGMASYRTPMNFPVWAIKDFGTDKKTSITMLYLSADSYKLPTAGKVNIIIMLENGDKIETSGSSFGDIKENGRQYGAPYYISSSFIITEDIWNKLLKSRISSYRVGSGEETLKKGVSNKLFERLICLKSAQYN